MDISVVVPFYNAERFLHTCIHALLAQDYPARSYEIILVDNNSTDQSTDIAKQYSRVRLLSEAKTGAYAARNRGVEEASGDLVAFTDADCRPAQDWLRHLARPMDNAHVKVVLGRHEPGKPSLALRLLNEYEEARNALVFNGTEKELYYGYTNNMAVRREVFHTIGPFAEWSRGADTLLVRGVVDRYSCASVLYAPMARVDHLELDSVRAYLRKKWVYGRSYHRYSKAIPTRPLSLLQRIQVLENVQKQTHCSMIQWLTLCGTLVIGLLAWGFGKSSAAIESIAK